MSKSKYQIITYDDDCGADKKECRDSVNEAMKLARYYKDIENYAGVIIYNLLTSKIYKLIGYFAESSMPTTK